MTGLLHFCGKHRYGEPSTSQEGVDSLVNHRAYLDRVWRGGGWGSWFGCDTEIKARFFYHSEELHEYFSQGLHLFKGKS